MANPNQILRQLDSELFYEVLNASPKKFREELFRRAGIKNKGGAFALTASGKTEARAKKLRAQLLEGFDLQTELSEEVIRNYLYTRRPLLAEALDFLGVEHDNGLTDNDLEFLAELPPERRTHLRDLLYRNHAQPDVDLYLAFMDLSPQ
jgi:hypothetical protein